MFPCLTHQQWKKNTHNETVFFFSFHNLKCDSSPQPTFTKTRPPENLPGSSAKSLSTLIIAKLIQHLNIELILMTLSVQVPWVYSPHPHAPSISIVSQCVCVVSKVSIDLCTSETTSLRIDACNQTRNNRQIGVFGSFSPNQICQPHTH